ncbi:hypothetical protein PFLUV_G00022750 [Perca fluviatilis]|uniref:Uncharacterized protein n=1 Tax=Perca fluviatilis TaxID=8168 RepID=A0A6A5EWD6_PERFL|nr:hypothetical protein PFLUV_G00022750 [Perca fluviatilis]
MLKPRREMLILESLCAKLAKHNATLYERLEDLGRRQNLRVIGIPEDTEGPQVTAFMEDFFSETLGMPIQPNQLPICDQARRSLVPKPQVTPPADHRAGASQPGQT